MKRPKDQQKDGGKEKDEVEELKNQLVRVLADYDNLRKRTESEKEVWFKFAAERIVVRLLPILDSLESAQNHLKDQGLGIALSEFKKILTEEGLIEISPKKGDEFDPEVHEAIELVEGGEKGKIAELVLTGWKFEDLPAQPGGKVVRPAKVKVYGEKSEKKEELEKETQRGDYV